RGVDEVLRNGTQQPLPAIDQAARDLPRFVALQREATRRGYRQPPQQLAGDWRGLRDWEIFQASLTSQSFEQHRSPREVGFEEANGATSVPCRERLDLVGAAFVDERYFQRVCRVAAGDRNHQSEVAVHRRAVDRELPPIAEVVDQTRQMPKPSAT